MKLIANLSFLRGEKLRRGLEVWQIAEAAHIRYARMYTLLIGGDVTLSEPEAEKLRGIFGAKAVLEVEE